MSIAHSDTGKCPEQVAAGGTTLLYGAAAQSWLADSANIAKWTQLYERCPWSVAFLSPGYYRLWLKHYGELWTPLLLLASDRSGGIAALMPLAVRDGIITGAGAHQAEYHGWIGDEANASTFLGEALVAISNRFPKHTVRLRYLPPGLPAERVLEPLRRNPRVFVRSSPRHTLDLDNAEIENTLRKKGNKSKINRLKRFGTLELRRLDDAAFDAQIDAIGNMYDLRQGALNNSCPFHDDARKRAFHLDWMRSLPEQLYVGGMFLNDKLISALMLVLSRREAHLAIPAHAPEHAQNSPSKLHIYQTALELPKLGVSRIDLTPGGDEWKARFATRTDLVYELVHLGNARAAAIERTKTTLKTWIRAASARIGFPASSIGGMARTAAARLARTRATPRQDVYVLDLASAHRPAPNSQMIEVNSLPALFAMAGKNRQDALHQGLSRLERGDSFLSSWSGEMFNGLVWMRSGDTARELLSTLRIPVAADAAVISDMKMHGGADERALIAQVLAHLKDRERMRWTYMLVPVDDHRLRQIVQDIGFSKFSNATGLDVTA